MSSWSATVASGRLYFSGSLQEAVQGSDLVFLAVGTPMRRGDGYADLTYIFEAVDEMAPHLNELTSLQPNLPCRSARAAISSGACASSGPI